MVHTEEHKQKIRLSMLGKVFSEEHKRKIGNAHRGMKRSPESRAKMSKWQIGRKLPEETKKRMSVSHKWRVGEFSANWKGGVTSENQKARKSIEKKVWQNAVFSRDGYTCRKSGARGGRLVAHHILNFSSHPELRFAIDNGITFSEKVHREFHRKYGIKNNTLEQVNEFLKTKLCV